MVSILINIIQHEQYFFFFRHMFLLSAWFSQSHTTSCSSLMYNHQVNNKCNRVKGWRWRWLIYALHIFLSRNNMLHVFRSSHHCSWKLPKFHRKTPVLKSLFSLKWWNYKKRHWFCINKPYFCRKFFLIDWCHKRLKNTQD